jgi:hypothetical protein
MRKENSWSTFVSWNYIYTTWICTM